MRLSKVLLRVVLIVLVAVVGLEIGIKFTPKLTSWTGGARQQSGLPSAVSREAQPDWGGGRLSVSNRSTAGAIDSVTMASGGDGSKTKTFSGSASAVVLRQKPDSDYALTMAVQSPSAPGRTAVFEVPSSDHFRKELLPGDGDAEPPAADIPLYPQSHCRMQVGRGTATFIGFYLTPDSIEAVRTFYVRTLSKLGWARVAAGRAGFLETFIKRNEDRTVVVQLRKQDSLTTRIGLVVTNSGSVGRSGRG
jgi:hypothetical protein